MTLYDYIIVGQGIGGACLAITLVNRGYKVVVYDQPDQNISSVKAAGLFNPVTGRNMAKTWMASKIFPVLREFYQEVEEISGRKFYNPVNIYRPFKSVKESNDWMGKSVDEENEWFIDTVNMKPKYARYIYDPLGGLELKYSGYIDVPVFLEAVRDIVGSRGNVREETFDESKVRLNENFLSYKDINAAHLIFCEGPSMLSNSFFKWLPLELLGGEMLDVKFELPFPLIFNRGVFVLPVNGKRCIVGATYNRQLKEPRTTPEGKSSLIKKLNKLVRVDFIVKGQSAGVRPVTIDRRPLLGFHPIHRNVGIFNGLGTKGVSLAPYFAKHFVEHLENGKELAPEVDINRFLTKFIN